MDDRLLEQIDACRVEAPGAGACRLRADDLRDPAMRELAEAVARGDNEVHQRCSRVAAADAAISAAVRDVPVPADLAERLLVALKAAEQGEPTDAGALHSAAVASQHPPGDVVPAKQAMVSRRVWVGWGIAAAVAAAAAVACLLYPWPPQHVTPEEIAQQAQMFYDAQIAHAEASAWKPGRPTFDEPVLNGGILPPPQRWREVTLDGYAARAYDLLGEGSFERPKGGRGSLKRAVLLVIDRRVRGLNDAPPHDPVCTHGRCIGIWQTESQVYALVVEGSLNDYQQLTAQGSYT
jgi:hypothetical protein